MKTVIDDEKGTGLDAISFEFDERDTSLTAEDRAVILFAFESGLASIRALEKIAANFPNASPVAMELAPQIFAQSVGASFGIVFKEDTEQLMFQVVSCASIVTMSEEKREKFLAALTDGVERAKKARH